MSQPLKHQTIKDALLQEIRTGTLAVGALVPAERELMARFGVSRLTIRHALDRLEGEGFITRHRGKGTFVRSQAPRTQAAGTAKRLIGMAMAGIDQTSMRLMRACEADLRAQGHRILIADCDGLDWEVDAERIRALIDAGVSGLVIYPFTNAPALRFYRELLATGLPVVFVDSLLTGIDADHVTTDNLGGACAGTTALLDAGCRRIAFCSGHLDAWTSQERLAGCRKALWARGLDLDQSCMRIGGFVREFGQASAEWLLANDPGADGWFFANHIHAEGAIRCLLGRGQAGASPRICSFDFADSAFSGLHGVTSIEQPLAAIGRQAAERLLLRIEERSAGLPRTPGRHLLLPAEVRG